jgi:tRNA-dihydrouridine synthase
VADKGAKHAQAEMRAHLAWYTKGYPDGADVRRLIMRSKDHEEVLQAVETCYGKTRERNLAVQVRATAQLAERH